MERGRAADQLDVLLRRAQLQGQPIGRQRAGYVEEEPGRKHDGPGAIHLG